MATNKRRAALIELVSRKARRDLTTYKRLIYKRYQHGRHLAALDAHLMAVAQYVESGGREGVGRLIVEMPPRHGKTLTTSRLFPTWFLGRNPDCRVMLVSYGQSLAAKNSRQARGLVASPIFNDLFDIELATDSRRADAWDIARHEGGCDALGIGGAATGKGAHLLVVDDPIKNREEAESSTYRDKAWDSYQDDLLTRLEPGGAVILMMTRWHQDDLIGRALKNTPDAWTRLRLPALAEADDPLGRTVGEALWPWRYPRATLERIRDGRAPYSWSSLYQQNPVPAEGGIFKRAWFQMARPPGEVVRAARYWDLAMSEKTSADYTVGVKMGLGADGQHYILDVVRRRIDWGDLTAWIAEVMLADGPDCMQGIEQAGYMSRAIQSLNSDPRLHGYAIVGHVKDKDKVTTALPLASKLAAGMLWTVDAAWTETFIDELCSFPAGAHDDQVDAAAGAWAMLDEAAVIGVGDMAYAEYGTLSNAY